MARPAVKSKNLWQITVSTSLEAEDAVGDLLQTLTGRPTALYIHEETKAAFVSVYCSRRTEWPKSRHARLLAGLERISASGLNLGTGEVTTQSVKKEDWAESWKRHFKPIEIGKRLLIKPSWIQRQRRKNQAVIILDPGLSFGTGNHPTTAFCLHSLAINRQDALPQSFLDIGTGSGILAIAAAKLGYAPVRAFDFDKDSVRVALENAAINRVLPLLKISRSDITKLSADSRIKYDFVCANLISNLLLAERQRIVNRVKPGGHLVVAGILKEEFASVRAALEKLGLKLLDHRVDKEWCSGCFETPKKN